MGPRAGLEAVEKKKSFPSGNRTWAVQPVARRYTDSKFLFAQLVDSVDISEQKELIGNWNVVSTSDAPVTSSRSDPRLLGDRASRDRQIERYTKEPPSKSYFSVLKYFPSELCARRTWQ
jgi:hypothetical protein